MASEFTFWQQVTLYWPAWLRGWLRVPDYSYPVADHVERKVVQEPVHGHQLVQPEWPQVADVVLITGTSWWQRPMEVVDALPIQEGDGTYEDGWWMNPPPGWGGWLQPLSIPRPASGYRWIRGHPRIGGEYDRHNVIRDPNTGYFWQFIGMNPYTKVVLSYAVFDADGRQVAGYAATAANHAMATLAWGPGSAAAGGHRLSITMPDYSGVDGTLPEGAWPRVGAWIVLKPEVAQSALQDPLCRGELRDLVLALSTWGAKITDRSGPEIRHAAIEVVAGQNNRTLHLEDLSKLYIRTSDFLEVVE